MSSSFSPSVNGTHGIITQTSGKGNITTNLPNPMPPGVSVEYKLPNQSSWTAVTGDKILIDNGQVMMYRAIRTSVQGRAILPLGSSPLTANFTFEWDNSPSITIEVVEEEIDTIGS